MDNSEQRRRRWQFSLRTLLLACAVVAILCATAQIAYERLTTVPLEQAVADFNADARKDPAGKFEPPLTEEEEVVAALKSCLPKLDARPEVKAIYQRIARTRRLPKDSRLQSLSYVSGYRASPPVPPESGGIVLSVMTGKNTGCGLWIRKRNDPAVASRESDSTRP